MAGIQFFMFIVLLGDIHCTTHSTIRGPFEFHGPMNKVKNLMVKMYLSQMFQFYVDEFCIKCNYFLVFIVFQRFLNSAFHLVTGILSYKGTIFISCFLFFHFIWFNSISYLLITTFQFMKSIIIVISYRISILLINCNEHSDELRCYKLFSELYKQYYRVGIPFK